MEHSTTTLLVRHLPKELSDQEKIDLICHFGADRVRPMGTKGPMKHAAFAQFDNPVAAEMCIKRLHQLEILGCKLIVEYAKTADRSNFPSELETKRSQQEIDKSENGEKDKQKSSPVVCSSKESADEVHKRYGIPYSRKPNLYYLYPPPSVSTLTNIANALASHPRFYVQVLHLMNKMNIPAPFGTVTATPPLASDARGLGRSDTADLENSSGQIEEVEMEYTSTEESELSDDEPAKTRQQQETVAKVKVKRPRKKMKLVKPDTNVQVKPSVIKTPREIFEQTQQLKPSHIQFNLTGLGNQANLTSQGNQSDWTGLGKQTVPHSQQSWLTGLGMPGLRDQSTMAGLGNQAILQSQQVRLTSLANQTIPQQIPAQIDPTNVSTSQTENNMEADKQVAQEGFGKIEPVASKPILQEEIQKPDVNYKIDPAKFYSYETIRESRLTKNQMKEFSVFKNYSAGEPTCRLYIKNLTKHTSEQDIVNLFGSYIDWLQESSYNSFDVRVMKEGRMKGQAFVSLPSEECAIKILRDCNAYVLNGKPMVIQFARSAKAKEVDGKK